MTFSSTLSTLVFSTYLNNVGKTHSYVTWVANELLTLGSNNAWTALDHFTIAGFTRFRPKIMTNMNWNKSNMCHIFESDITQGIQIYYVWVWDIGSWDGVHGIFRSELLLFRNLWYYSETSTLFLLLWEQQNIPREVTKSDGGHTLIKNLFLFTFLDNSLFA